MRPILSSGAAVALVLALSAGAGAAPQGTPAPQATPQPQRTPVPRGSPPGLIGHWSGTAKFTDDSAETPCQYVGATDPPAVTLEIAGEPNALKGKLTLDLTPPADSSCPPLSETDEMQDATISGSSLRFSDSAGRRWDLALVLDVLKGLVSSEGGLSGEVSLKRSATPTGAAQAPAAAAAGGTTPGATPDPSKGGGSFLSGVGGFVTANVIGLGALFGINKLANDTNKTGTGTVQCSPRSCVAGAPGEPCLCNTPLAGGGSCGSTASGVPFAMACSVPAMPCQTDLSCNNGICEDRFGTCPF